MLHFTYDLYLFLALFKNQIKVLTEILNVMEYVTFRWIIDEVYINMNVFQVDI